MLNITPRNLKLDLDEESQIVCINKQETLRGRQRLNRTPDTFDQISLFNGLTKFKQAQFKTEKLLITKEA